MESSRFKDIIEFAISDEIATYEFYTAAAEKIEDPDVKEIFFELADEELEHKRFLEEFLASGENKLTIERRVDYKLDEGIDKPILSTDMKFADAIALAIKKEKEAMDMYASLAKSSENAEVENVFLNLVEMERIHKTRLEDIYADVGYSEVW